MSRPARSPAVLGRVALLLVVWWAGGCTRTTLWTLDDGRGQPPDGGVADAAGDGRPPARPWAEHVATLGLPDCPPGAVLTVDTAADELDGDTTMADRAAAGATLSFFEALWIAANTSGPRTIAFDPAVFPPAAPATITLRGLDFFPGPLLSDLCIDGRERGVVLAWDIKYGADPDFTPCCPYTYPVARCPGCVFALGPGSRMMGLTLLGLPDALALADAQVAGCRLATDGERTVVTAGFGFDTLWALGQSRIGPGNVLAAKRAAVQAGRYGHADFISIEDNYFGYDPLTGAILDLATAVDLRNGAALRGNVVAVTSPAAIETGFLAGNSAASVELAGNFFGVDRNGAVLPAVVGGVGLLGHGGVFTVGPGNVIRGTAGGLVAVAPARVRITRNTITGNAAGIELQGYTPTPEPPVITAVTADGVTGTCVSAGLVEVFADPGGQGETFLGDAPCEPATGFSAPVAPPAGRNVTATLTTPEGTTTAFSAPVAVP